MNGRWCSNQKRTNGSWLQRMVLWRTGHTATEILVILLVKCSALFSRRPVKDFCQKQYQLSLVISVAPSMHLPSILCPPLTTNDNKRYILIGFAIVQYFFLLEKLPQLLFPVDSGLKQGAGSCEAGVGPNVAALPRSDSSPACLAVGVGDVCFSLTMRCFNDAMFSNS